MKHGSESTFKWQKVQGAMKRERNNVIVCDRYDWFYYRPIVRFDIVDWIINILIYIFISSKKQ